MDVSEDGMPLLLLVDKEYEFESEEFSAWNILFGYADGAPQRITEYPMGIGITALGDENYLVTLKESDFGGDYYLYRVQNVAAELIKVTSFFDNWHEGTLFVNDIEVSEEEYDEMWLSMSIEFLLRTDHPGTPYTVEPFEEYLSQSFTREEAAQIFIDYADTLG
jgi:hypothetical protein